MNDLTVDGDRHEQRGATGIYVRAKRAQKWDSVDIAELDHASLILWLRSRGGANEWAENVVAVLLGHSDA